MSSLPDGEGKGKVESPYKDTCMYVQGLVWADAVQMSIKKPVPSVDECQ